jgi:hypothetical protein
MFSFSGFRNRIPKLAGKIPETLKRSTIEIWLRLLKERDPAYQDVRIDTNALPHDGEILDHITMLAGDFNVSDFFEPPDSAPPEAESPKGKPNISLPLESVVPDLFVDRPERDLLASRLQAQRQYLDRPTFRATPL